MCVLGGGGRGYKTARRWRLVEMPVNNAINRFDN